MIKDKMKRTPASREESLTTLMRAAVEARTRLKRTRERLRELEAKLRGARPVPDDYDRKRNEALQDYIDATGKARVARTRLIKQLKERSV